MRSGDLKVLHEQESVLPLPTQARTEIVEETTAVFRHDWGRLIAAEQVRIKAALRASYELLRGNRRAFFAKLRRPLPVRLRQGYNSSLYTLRVEGERWVILAVDDDPIFRRTLVTLFRVVGQEDLEHAYGRTARSLYVDDLKGLNGAGS